MLKNDFNPRMVTMTMMTIMIIMMMAMAIVTINGDVTEMMIVRKIYISKFGATFDGIYHIIP